MHDAIKDAVAVEKIPQEGGNRFAVWLHVKHQHFRLDGDFSSDDIAQWFASQLRVALEKLVKQVMEGTT